MSEPGYRPAPYRVRESMSGAAFEIKGSVFTLSVMHLFTADLQAVSRELKARSAQAKEFFRNAPVVLDLQGLRSAEVDFPALAGLLRAHELIPVGGRNIPAEQQAAAIAAGFGLLATRPARESKPQEPAQPQASRLVTQPVRSGQQIYAQGGDLVVLAQVSAGAEILADGHIHAYGPMRGRALAGVRGDRSARIFCQALEAELVSVAGNYRVLEIPPEIPPEIPRGQARREQMGREEQVWGKPAQVYLADNRLIIEPL